MTKQIRFICLLLILTMSGFIMAGCGGSTKPESTQTTTEAAQATTASSTTATSDKIDTSTPVTLKYYLIGDEQKDSKAVWDEINKKMQADINTTIEPVIIPWADYSTKYPLIFASGEEFDMAWTGNWMAYADIASKGGFMELTQDMINKYCPDALKQLPLASFKQAKVNGKLYMIPFGEKTSDNNCVIIRGDLREKYNLSPINSLADLEKYCDAIVKNEKGIIPMSDFGPKSPQFVNQIVYGMNNLTRFVSSEYLAYDFTDANPAILSVADSPKFADSIKKVQDYMDKGYFSKAALTSKNVRGEDFKAGRGGVVFENLNDSVAVFQEVNKAHPEWKIEMADADFGGKIATQPAIVHGTAIHATSKNPERVLMATELLAYHEDYNHLVLYGLEGKNYNNADGAYEPLNSDYVGTNYSTWAFRGNYLLKLTNSIPSYDAIYKYQVDNSVTSPLCAFSPVSTNIKSELAACNDIWSTKASILFYSKVTDISKGIADLNTSLKSAGVDKIMSEVNAQVKKYLEDYNK